MYSIRSATPMVVFMVFGAWSSDVGSVSGRKVKQCKTNSWPSYVCIVFIFNAFGPQVFG